MMLNNKRIQHMALTCLLGTAACNMVSCSDDLSEDSHYKTPSFLTGNAYETLQKEGNYSIFLRGLELAGVKDVVDGLGIITVAAPSDEAFQTFLQKKGYSSIDEMYQADPQYVTKLISFHLLYYALDWNKLVNFRPAEGDNSTEADRANMAGMYFKFRTRSANADTREYNNDIAIEDTVTVCHYERFIPVFSNKYFETQALDASSNYEYFFPQSHWTGGNFASTMPGGFNICNASVTDTDNVITDNGYLYHIDQVLEPLETIYTELQKSGKYKTFLDLYDTYSYYSLDETETEKRGYNVYNHLHQTVPNIAMEWPSTSYLDILPLSNISYSLFAPSDVAIQEMFKNYWEPGCGYENVESLNDLIKKYFIFQSFAKSTRIVWPEMLKNPKVDNEIVTYYDTPINVNPDEVDDRIMCCNGVIYGMDRMDVPAIFSSVAGPAFKDVKFLPYLYVLDGSGQILTLASKNSDFITLIPDTAQFTQENIRLQKITDGYQLQQWDDEAGAYVSISSATKQHWVNIHVSTNAQELKTQGVQVVETNEAFQYWFICDGKITTNALFNQQLNPEYTEDPFVAFHEITREGKAWDNGHAYSYDYPGLFKPAESSASLENALAICNDKNYPYYLFAQLLQKADLVKNGKFFGPLTLDPESPRFVAFIPTNEAIKETIAKIPGCAKCTISDDLKITGTPTKADLSKYLCSYFITADRNAFTTYPYPSSEMKGVYETGGTNNIAIIDDGSTLAVQFTDGMQQAEGNIAPVTDKYHYLPFAFSDGAFHLINGILK